MSKTKKEVQVLDIAEIQPLQLKEFQGWKDKQELAVKDNPFVVITDTKTYEEGKRARTNLRTARTSLSGQDKVIASTLAAFRKRCGDATFQLIEITLGAEKKQQDEVKKYEDEKERRAEEKRQKLEAEFRALENEATKIADNLTAITNKMTHETIGACEVEFNEMSEAIPMEYFENVRLNFNATFSRVDDAFEVRKNWLIDEYNKEQEEMRLKAEKKAQEEEAKRLEKQRKDQEEADRILHEAQVEADNKLALANNMILSAKIVAFAIGKGYEAQEDADGQFVYPEKANGVIFALPSKVTENEDGTSSMFFKSLQEAEDAHEIHMNKIMNWKKKEAQRKESEAKIKKLETEAAMDNLKNTNTPEEKSKDIEVVDAEFVFPDDLDWSTDCDKIKNFVASIHEVIDVSDPEAAVRTEKAKIAVGQSVEIILQAMTELKSIVDVKS